MKESFYLSVPIYYVNGVPHIGHFYSTAIADTIARYNKISGKQVKFVTGVDENSQKALLAAEEKGMEIMLYLDEMAGKHKAVWNGMNIQYTDFIRTTEGRHHKMVQEVLETCHKRGDIYQGEYEGMYCVGCEGFKKDDDLVFMNKTSSETFPITPKVKESDNIIKVCPDHLKTPDTIKEKNYFFKLKKYQIWLEEFYAAQPEFVIPSDRFNEVKAFVDRGLEDFSISRETNTFGIKLPFDDTQVTYVWFDALFNYYTACKYSRGADKDNENFIDESGMWPADLHVVGKDIIRFHAIYWPAMLASYFGLGEERDGILHYTPADKEKLPGNILTTGFLTVDGQKISKSLGNVIDPVEYSNKYSKDLLALYLFSAFNIGQDGDFDQKQSVLMYNAKLANNLGNLVNRVVVLSLKLDGVLEGSNENKDEYKKIEIAMIALCKSNMKQYDLKSSLHSIFALLHSLNKYVDETEPWSLLKTDEIQAKVVLYNVAEGLRKVGLCLYPFFPEKMSEMFEKLGLEGYKETLENGKLEELLHKKETFHIKEKGNNLFERIEVE